MSIAPRPGMLRFDGDVAVFYMAICKQCDMALPHPTEMSREMWATGHQATGHAITFALDVRPDAGQTEVRRRQLVDRLREKYSNPMPPYQGGGTCAGKGKTCDGLIFHGQEYVQWNGKLWHAECLDDGSYLRMATVADIAPGVLADVEPVTMKTWMPGDPSRPVGFYNVGGNGPAPATIMNPLDRHAGLLAGMAGQLSKVIGSDATVAHVPPPKKPNARERRRQRREGKQWRRGS